MRIDIEHQLRLLSFRTVDERGKQRQISLPGDGKAVIVEMCFPRECLEIFPVLEENNNKTWFDAHRPEYEGYRIIDTSNPC
jgi:hypothetical protein